MDESQITDREVNTTVVGLGYVGYPLLKLLDKKKFPAVGYDIDQLKIKRALEDELKATSNPAIAFKDADIIVICVPTPVDKNHHPDLSYLISATETLSKHIKKGALVILESTVAPGTTEEIMVPIIEKNRGWKAGEDFFVAYCPERIDPGNKKWTVENIPRVVGGINKKSLDLAYAFYNEVIDAQILKLSSIRAAEAVKIVENAFRDINIAFVNELAKSFDKMGIDIVEVIKGASTKPFGFLPHYPGAGVGGHCIAVDPYYLIEKAEKIGFSHRFLKLAREINNSMPEYTVHKVMVGLNEVGLPVKGSKIAILGVAYKGGVDDTRESPAFPIIDMLKKLGANLTIFDPYVPQESTAKSLDEAIENKDCIVIVTDHPEFKDINGKYLSSKGIRVVIDGRNILNKEDIKRYNIVYLGIGRS